MTEHSQSEPQNYGMSCPVEIRSAESVMSFKHIFIREPFLILLDFLRLPFTGFMS